MFKGILARNVDSIPEFEGQYTWRRRLEGMSKAMTKWSKEKVGVGVNFQEQIVALKERKGTADSQEFRDEVIAELNRSKGIYIHAGFDVLTYIYDKFCPDGWMHTPEYDPNPNNTRAFTNIGDTITVAYVEPGAIGDPEDEIQRVLSISISLELLHMLLYRKQALAGKRPDPRYFEDAVHENYHQHKFEEFEGYTFLEVPAEP